MGPTAMVKIIAPRVRQQAPAPKPEPKREWFRSSAVQVTNSRWAAKDIFWGCPACRRSKVDIYRKTRRGELYGKVVRHHCHTAELVDEVLRHFRLDYTHRAKVFTIIHRFDDVEVCEDCNIADARAKKIVGAPHWFSFSAIEIQRFIIVERNKNHRINPPAARLVYAKAMERHDEIFGALETLANAVRKNDYYSPGTTMGLKASDVFCKKCSADVEEEYENWSNGMGRKAMDFLLTDNLDD